MNIKTSLMEAYVNFVDTIKKQKTYFETIMFLIASIISSLLFYLLFKSLSE